MIVTRMKTFKQYAKRIYRVAYYDELTGLPNLIKFKEEVNELLTKNPNEDYVCIAFDIRNFKMINSIYGSDVGDKVLIKIAQLVSEDIKIKYTGIKSFTRAYADTFMIFSLKHEIPVDSIEQKGITEVFEELKDILVDFKFELSFGRYMPQKGDDAEIIFENTHLAHNLGKQQQPNIVVDYAQEYQNQLREESTIRNRVENGLLNQEFKVYLQPKIDMKTNQLCGAEALARWERNGKIIPPNEFIPLLEKTGLIIQLDKYIFEKCCELLATWKREGRKLVPISVNFSRQHLSSFNFVHELKDMVHVHTVNPNNLIIEFTENIAVENHATIARTVDDLQKQDFIVSMDDFGSGYSSIGFLDEIRVNELKLDMSLIRNISSNSKTYAITKNIINMAKDIGVIVVAEGVETKEQQALLKEMRCDIGQGYYFSKPIPNNEIFIKTNYE